MNRENYLKTQPVAKVTTGVIFILLGIIMLTKTLGLVNNLPDWLISWPVFLILLGVLSGIKHSFRNFGSYLMIGIGGVFLAERLVVGVHVGSLIFPVVIVATGLHVLTGRTMLKYK